jgi:hypothetical protein
VQTSRQRQDIQVYSSRCRPAGRGRISRYIAQGTDQQAEAGYPGIAQRFRPAGREAEYPVIAQGSDQ